jgi:hypothetical protein
MLYAATPVQSWKPGFYVVLFFPLKLLARFLPAAFTTWNGRREIGISCLHSELAGFVNFYSNSYVHMKYGKPV